MHSAYGMLFQRTAQSIFDARNQRTYGEARSAYALAAPLPYVAYSDLYDHASFIRGVATSGFCGLLWSPEVRDAESAEDLIRRVQAVVFSPQARAVPPDGGPDRPHPPLRQGRLHPPARGPAAHAADPRLRQLTVHVRGSGRLGISLYEDDGETLAYRSGEMNRIELAWDAGEVRLTRSGKARVPEYGVEGSVLHRE